jgi:hypothetical protein
MGEELEALYEMEALIEEGPHLVPRSRPGTPTQKQRPRLQRQASENFTKFIKFEVFDIKLEREWISKTSLRVLDAQGSIFLQTDERQICQ